MTTPIPQPPGVPFIGNIFNIDQNNTWVSLQELAAKYGPIFKIKVLKHQIVFIGSVALLEEICDEKRFRKCVTGPIVEIRHSVHDALFTAYDNEPSWGIAHRIMAPLLSPSALHETFKGARDAASQLTAKWSQSSDPSQAVNITDALKRENVQAAVLCLFNQETDLLDGPEPPIIKAMERATLEAVKRAARPRILSWLLYQRMFDQDTKTMRSFAADIVAKRTSQEGEAPNDMLHALLHGKDPETGKSLNAEQVIDEIVSLLIGTITAPNFMAFAFCYLLQDPQEIAKARDEIDSVIGRIDQFNLSHLSKLPYCEAILREALRLSAAAPGFNIEPLPPPVTQGPVMLAGGKYQVPADQVMIAVLASVNRDPAVFSEPDKFRPARMLGEAFDSLPQGAKKWFGNGKRECIGKQFAWQWAMVTFVTIVAEIDLSMANPNYQLKMDGAFSLKPLDFFVKVAPRGQGATTE
ncbi:bifunctional P-450:NADPH-P450 reductase [Glonium stellatum]|uniref:Bifunctional P-450:NADPH-P450 reductase n=1 Tax=Glonium stellatum TaxID=574774 RepID=A0A8E2JUS2_9PEZI|nr:bifunctional P-450:NADPH-P450 reductase [Glonium stellatum]